MIINLIIFTDNWNNDCVRSTETVDVILCVPVCFKQADKNYTPVSTLSLNKSKHGIVSEAITFKNVYFFVLVNEMFNDSTNFQLYKKKTWHSLNRLSCESISVGISVSRCKICYSSVDLSRNFGQQCWHISISITIIKSVIRCLCVYCDLIDFYT